MDGTLDKSGRTSRSRRPLTAFLSAYIVFVLILLGVLRLHDHLPKWPTTNALPSVPSALLTRVKYLYAHLARNTAPIETTTFLTDSTPSGLVSPTWTVSCDSADYTAYFLFESKHGSLVQFSQTSLQEWSQDRPRWTVNDAHTATVEGQRYLSVLGWESPGCHWEREGKPQLTKTFWVLIYRQGNRHARLHIHRWQGALLMAVLDSQDNTPSKSLPRI